MLNIILFGPPGSGKGTQAEKLKNQYNLIHLSTGEVIREEMRSGSDIGKLAAEQMKGGKLASDELVCGIIGNFLHKNRGVTGVLYDGFPRTLFQAEGFDRMLGEIGESVTLMVALDVPDAEAIKRIKSRALISGRADDQDEEVIQKRLDIYRGQAAVVADFYKNQGKYYSIYGMESIEETFESICKVIDSLIDSKNKKL